MTINIRAKGAGGELEVCKLLEPIVRRTMLKHGMELPKVDILQRNQNQSAVGGSDISNTFGLCIEVKRQEALSLGPWWKQCDEAAKRNNEHPVLMYRQNHKPWKVRTLMEVRLPAAGGAVVSHVQVIGEMELPSFLVWFEHWVDRKCAARENLPRV